MSNPVRRYLTTTARRFAAFGPDARGLAAVEFAMILPIMLVALFGIISVTSVIALNRKITLVARTLSDLTSQNDYVLDATDIPNFFAIGRAMLTPYKATSNPFSGGPLRMTITQLYINPANGQARVQWSRGDDARSVGDVVSSMPANLIGKDASNKVLPNQYFILGEVSYRYAPAILPGVAAVPLKESTYTRPRVTANYYCVRMDKATPCPTS
ncbi:MAG: pilus assembly protein [Xanthobacteraceae bacterium]|nr:pilus assembly protein [Xanthobacteraceae bacterium]